mmetsp:Transcript_20504/g.38901  ORF Transcript_20504/g.38901 Transcript_20504/m.38901 type:complete len:155 (+) Transcript_20504:122-586(+)|eukprot:scaffold7227_cov160-Amphora_coffeaeformis.AAC.3
MEDWPQEEASSEMIQEEGEEEEERRRWELQHAAVQRDTQQTLEHLAAQKEWLDEQVQEQERLVAHREQQLDQSHSDWCRGRDVVKPFQTIALEYVDQDKMERKRQGQLRAQEIREAARREREAWRESFRAKFVNGKNPSIIAAQGGGKLFMTSK